MACTESRFTPVPFWYRTPSRVHASGTPPSQPTRTSSAPRSRSRRTYSPLSNLSPSAAQADALPASHSPRSLIASLFPGWQAGRVAITPADINDESRLMNRARLLDPSIASRDKDADVWPRPFTGAAEGKFHDILAHQAHPLIRVRLMPVSRLRPTRARGPGRCDRATRPM
jgi:hypothetical protein